MKAAATPESRHKSAAVPRSAITGNFWPAIPNAGGARMLALQYQLDESQWWPVDVLRGQQFRQLAVLLRHAAETVPFYRERLAGLDLSHGVSPEQFAAIPLLQRQDIQLECEALISTRVPPEHGRCADGETSGSTGRPIRFRGTELTDFFWHVFTLREHLWHHRDFSGKLAAIRSRVEEQQGRGWGPSTDVAFDTGALVTLGLEASVSEQACWLAQQNPDYLMSVPSNIRALAQYCREHRIKPDRLREVRTYGETLHPDLRELCKEAWGVPVVDVYSCREIGYLALQCPDHERYHVLAESVIVEVLDRGGRACAPGEIGSVVITPLHNFAMPLIRYEIGDYAEAGAQCPCGRGLPVLERIVGRVRNMLQLPDGESRWPRFGEARFAEIAPVRQFQVVQTQLDQLQVNLVVARPLTAADERKIRERILAHVGHPFATLFVYHDAIARGAGGKYEDFRCEIAR